MNIKESTRHEIEERLNKLGDYVKIGYLTECLKKQLDFDTKKFVMVQLVGLYENKKMYGEAAKLMKNAADINATFKSKIDDFVKSGELFIKAENYDDADISFNKALAMANTQEKIEIKYMKKNLYSKQAKEYLRNDKRAHAMRAYEKFMTMDLNEMEKKESQKTLLDLYLKLGKMREYSALNKTA